MLVDAACVNFAVERRETWWLPTLGWNCRARQKPEYPTPPRPHIFMKINHFQMAPGGAMV
jgi:hypothetical protein